VNSLLGDVTCRRISIRGRPCQSSAARPGRIWIASTIRFPLLLTFDGWHLPLSATVKAGRLPTIRLEKALTL
jgi:hypothetical protein